MQGDLNLPTGPGDLPLGKAITSCEQCSKALREHKDVLVVTKHFKGFKAQIHFCGQDCANTWYLKYLRESGL